MVFVFGSEFIVNSLSWTLKKTEIIVGEVTLILLIL